MPKPADAACRPAQDLEPSPALSIDRERARAVRRPQARHPGHRRRRCALLKASLGKGDEEGGRKRSKSSRRRSAARRRTTASRIEADQMIDRRSVGAVRRGRAAACQGCHGRSPAGIGGPRLRRGRLRALQVHRLCRGGKALVRQSRCRDSLDEGVIAIDGKGGTGKFVAALGALRLWGREPTVKMR